MIHYVVFGITYAFACAVQPGPFQAFIVSQTLTVGWRRTLWASLAPVISDGPIILIVLAILHQTPIWLEPVLFSAGGVFLLFLAFRAWQEWRDHHVSTEQPPSGNGTLWKAALVNFLNPNPWLGWSLVMGPFFLEGWRQSPANGMALLLSFYLTMGVATAAIIVLVAATGRLGDRVSRTLVGLSAVALGLFGLYAMYRGLSALPF